jgi:hypothetical protein
VNSILSRSARVLAVALGLALMTSAVVPAAPAAAARTYSYNMYKSSLVRWQSPSSTACVASSTLMMLNFIGNAGAGGPDFKWRSTISYATQTAILKYQRANDTQRASSGGTDAHGWVAGLNYYGWGSIDAGVYADTAYGSYLAAAKAAIQALAKFHKPVGILGWGGSHAQLLNGYRVTGGDPALTLNFTIVGVYITDPLRSDGYRNAFISNKVWQNGDYRVRFRMYLHTDNPYRDRIGGKTGNAEWYRKWVIVVPVK